MTALNDSCHAIRNGSLRDDIRQHPEPAPSKAITTREAMTPANRTRASVAASKTIRQEEVRL